MKLATSFVQLKLVNTTIEIVVGLLVMVGAMWPLLPSIVHILYRHRYLVGLLSVVIGMVGWASPAFAYNGSGTANWADNNWNTTANELIHFGDGNFNGDDCTIFVSWALYAGGGYPWTDSPGYGNGSYTFTTTQ